jgi:stage II sporulation protein D
VKIGGPGQWLELHRVEADLSAALMGPLSVRMADGAWSITDDRGFVASVEPQGTLVVSLLDDVNNELVQLQDDAKAAPRPYPGQLRLVSRHDQGTDCFDVINDVALESYLPGVLAGELYSHWNLQTFATQAVAARSFAATESAVFADRRHYDVTNTAASQMYLGAVKNQTAREAVAMTRGQVLGYDGLLVSGYYSSCCGGLAASAVDAIGSNPVNDVPPLHGRSGIDVCTAAPVYQWAAEQPLEVLTRRLIAFGQERRINDLIQLTRVQSIDVVATNANGRPTRMLVKDRTNAEVELTAENFRRAANFSGQGLQPPAKLLKSSNFTSTVHDTFVAFEGNGLGHGVGMCQYGAEALAKEGKAFDEIVGWYYPGAEVVSAYG